MANICTSTYYITSDLEEPLFNLYNYIKGHMKNDKRTYPDLLNDIDNFKEFSTETIDSNDNTSVSYKIHLQKYGVTIDIPLYGEVFNCQYVEEYKTLIIVVESKWSPKPATICALTEYFFKSYTNDLDCYSISYIGEEPGMGVYVSDLFNEKRYNIDTVDDELIPKDIFNKLILNDLDNSYSEAEVIKVLQYNLNTDETNIDELLKMLDNDSELCEKLFVHEYSYVQLEEYFD